MILEMEVYSNEQWQGPDRKGCYIVKGDLDSLRAFVLRWRDRDMERDPNGMTIYHNFTLDPFERLTQDDIDALGPEKFYALDELTRPWMYALCPHGLSEWLCEGPQHYPLDI